MNRYLHDQAESSDIIQLMFPQGPIEVDGEDVASINSSFADHKHFEGGWRCAIM